MNEHIFAVGFEIDSYAERREVQQWLIDRLVSMRKSEANKSTRFWIAEDDRIDGSDNDSAVWVPKGTQNNSQLEENNSQLEDALGCLTELEEQVEGLRNDLRRKSEAHDWTQQRYNWFTRSVHGWLCEDVDLQDDTTVKQWVKDGYIDPFTGDVEITFTVTYNCTATFTDVDLNADLEAMQIAFERQIALMAIDVADSVYVTVGDEDYEGRINVDDCDDEVQTIEFS
jgi:hypothetical protein